jgi:subtilisin family serine protease
LFDTPSVRRSLVALVVASLTLLSLAAPASAGPTTDIVVGRPDGSFTVRTVPAATAAQQVARAEETPGVAWAEVDVPMHAVGAVTPNDPEFPSQWGLTRTRTTEAWNRTKGDGSVVVAVVDSGVDATHPDLVGSVLSGTDFVSDGKSGDPDGHGTAVAGVIAGRGNNGVGITGYCWDCKVLPVRVLDSEGSGSSGTVAAGIKWAATHGADIINLSLAGDESSKTMEIAIAQAIAAGVIVVGAAGNQTRAGQDLTVPQYPAAIEGVLSVIATDKADAAYPWTFRGTWADLAGPGCTRTTAPHGAYADECGTSFAAPAVAGILALAKTAFPGATPAVLQATVLDTTSRIGSTLAAHGRVDAAAFLDALARTQGPSLTPQRVAGTTRTSTAIALSQRAHAAASSVVLARADSYADALGASSLAGKLDAPVLLTGSTALDPTVAAEIRRLGATTVWLAGGQAALSSAVASGVQALGIADVRRLGGTTRYDTARLFAQQVGSTSAYVVGAADWPSAVAASGLAALTKAPILLVDQGSVPAVTTQALAGTTDITVIGDAATVSDAVLAALRTGGRTVNRMAGANRYETSKLVAAAAAAAGADGRNTWLATGANWPDALAAGPAAAAAGGVLLLIDGQATSTPAVTSWIQSVGGLSQLVIVGGEASVTSSALSTLGTLLTPWPAPS